LTTVANHQHPAAGSLTTGKIISRNPVTRCHRCPSKNPPGRPKAWSARPTLTVLDLQPGSEGSRSR
jgi:hypothetical protein